MITREEMEDGLKEAELLVEKLRRHLMLPPSEPCKCELRKVEENKKWLDRKREQLAYAVDKYNAACAVLSQSIAAVRYEGMSVVVHHRGSHGWLSTTGPDEITVTVAQR